MFVINIGRLLIDIRDTASQDLVVYYEVKRVPPPIPGYVILSYHLCSVLFRAANVINLFRCRQGLRPLFEINA